MKPVGDPLLIVAGVCPMIPSPFSSRDLVLPLPICYFSFQGKKGIKGKKETKRPGRFCWPVAPVASFLAEAAAGEQVQVAGPLVLSEQI